MAWSESPDHYESLAVSLRAIAAEHGCRVGYDAIIAGLGLGSLITTTQSDPVGKWMTFARDAQLHEVTERLGLRTRAMHPPEAALRLAESAEFPDHFRDSYVPLIARALDHGQRILAWRGWSPPRENLWGVIIGMRGNTIVGHSLWHEGTPTVLSAAAHSVIVVEGSAESAHEPPTEDVVRLAAAAVVEQYFGSWSNDPAVLTGDRAYAHWERTILSHAVESRDHLAAARQNAFHMRVLISSRRHLARFLREAAREVSREWIGRLQKWSAACEDFIDRLRSWELSDGWYDALADDAGRQRAARAIATAREIESTTASNIREFLRPR